MAVAHTLADYTETTEAVARRLGVPRRTIARWAAKGKIAHIKSPGGWRMFRPEDVDDFETELLSRRVDGAL